MLMEIYLTKKFYDEIDKALIDIRPGIQIHHQTRKKFMEIFVRNEINEEELEKLKKDLKDYFSSRGIEVSFRV